MLAAVKSFFAWFARKAESIIAVCSLLVAVSALYVSIQTSRTDLEYKEVSIQPRLWLGGEWDHMGVELRNTGLGPALITGVAFVQNQKCITSTDKDRDDFTIEFDEFIKTSRDDLYTKSFPPMPWKPSGAKAYSVETNSFGPGDVIRPGESIMLIQLSADNVAEFKTLNGEVKVAAKAKFAAAAFALPVQVRACSLTGRTCGIIGNALPAQCKGVR